MFNSLFQKTLLLASHKRSKFFLAIVAFAESSIFPIPPDIMVVPMIIAKKNEYFKIFLIATISSVFGGLLGYYIGLTFIDIAIKVVELYGYENKVFNLKNDLTNDGNLYVFLATLFLAGFTPLPFKVFTITSGIIGFNIFLFFFICLISRALRFFVVSYLSYKFGNNFIKFMSEKRTNVLLLFFFILVLIISFVYFIYTIYASS
jgi:membrane protein YqaA with SNARE-associated domain